MKTIAILAAPNVQLLDVCGPSDVFAEANVQAGREVYSVRIVGSVRGSVRSSSGVRIVADYAVADGVYEPIDTLLIAGAPNAAEVGVSAETSVWIARCASRARRFGSVCTGAFYLAAAGLLSRRRVTTHWAVADTLAATYPDTVVDADAIYVRDGRLRTAAGVTAGLDLALALVEEDLGREIAMRVAGQLVMFFKRPGGQMQFSRKGEAAPAGRSALQEVQRYVAANLADDLTVARLAARTGLSPRHFARMFTEEVGETPASWVEMARIDAARRMLEDGDAPKKVAVLCGFADVDVLRRSFKRRLGVTPADYRKRNGSLIKDRADR